MWAFVYAKQRAVPNAKTAPDGAGDAWTFSAIDAQSKRSVSVIPASIAGVTPSVL